MALVLQLVNPTAHDEASMSPVQDNVTMLLSCAFSASYSPSTCSRTLWGEVVSSQSYYACGPQILKGTLGREWCLHCSKPLRFALPTQAAAFSGDSWAHVDQRPSVSVHSSWPAPARVKHDFGSAAVSNSAQAAATGRLKVECNARSHTSSQVGASHESSVAAGACIDQAARCGGFR